jgi:hypothetical protein
MLMVLGIVFAGLSGLGAQNQSLRGMTFNGATGLYMVPSGYVGWERSAGLDLGYHGIINGYSNHLFNINISMFGLAEVSFAFDIQDDYFRSKNDDLIFGSKLELFTFKNTSVGLGGNLQILNLGGERWSNKRLNRALNGHYIAGQIYGAVTYRNGFFGSETEISVVMGKTLYGGMDSSIDFGMGFDVLLLPQYLGRFVHVIVDFSNFSYSDSLNPKIFVDRGILNTGLRLDLSAIPPLKNFKINIEVLMTDTFDEGRSFALGAVFGFPL